MLFLVRFLPVSLVWWGEKDWPVLFSGSLGVGLWEKGSLLLHPLRCLGEVVVQHAALVPAGKGVCLGGLPPTYFPALLSLLPWFRGSSPPYLIQGEKAVL